MSSMVLCLYPTPNTLDVQAHHISKSLRNSSPTTWTSSKVPTRVRGSMRPAASNKASTSDLRSQANTIDKTAKKKRELSQVWREVQGAHNWEGMLDPMDDILRSEIIRYGEFSQACYDAFDFDPFSKYCGSCKYPRRQLFNGVGMSDYGYEITRYLYATSNINLPGFFQNPRSKSHKLWSPHANWMGFVAVATDEEEIRRLGRRDIVIAWRGTVTKLEWVADLMDYLRPAQMNPLHPHPDVRVEAGFLNLYTAREKDCRFSKLSAREQVDTEIRRLLEKYKGENLSITVTGHSLGSALAMITAYDLAESGINRPNTDKPDVPVSVFSFAGPRVGNAAFKDRCEELGLKFLRVVNVQDGVPKVPGVLFNENTNFFKRVVEKLPWHYCHVGVELALDHAKSPFLKETSDPVCAHDLEVHLHLMDGYHGSRERFYLASGRDPALVNKACDVLREHYEVPPHWRQDANRGLIKNSQGLWVQPDRDAFVEEFRRDEEEDDLHYATTSQETQRSFNYELRR